MKYSALIGNPVEHSISPKLFQFIMERKGYEYAHLKLNVKDPKLLKNTIDNLFDLGFCGINITCPYKIDTYNIVDKFLDGSQNIYSINTIYKKDNKIYGCNTDGKAAILSIERVRKIKKQDNIVIFGSGGVAYSIFYEISQLTNNITIINESIVEAEKMKNKINTSAICYDLNDEEKYFEKLIKADIVINATSVGMYPNISDCILKLDILKLLPKNKIFFDVVFNPWETKFLKLAKKYNHISVSGGYMLIYQATLALSKWITQDINLSEREIKIAERIVKNEIKKYRD